MVSAQKATINAPQITQEHLDTAVILVYAKRTISNSITLLPLDLGGYEFILWGLDIGEIVLQVRRLDGSNFSIPFADIPFRYVIIPGGISAKVGTDPDFRKMTYVEVMDYFGLAY